MLAETGQSKDRKPNGNNNARNTKPLLILYLKIKLDKTEIIMTSVT